MDQIAFHHDTVLSDVHMHLPGARHLMTRLNSVGQPVFVSRFKVLVEGHDNSDRGKVLDQKEKLNDPQGDTKTSPCQDEEKDGEGNVEPFLDEDGDLDVPHRPRENSAVGGRDLVCPVILKQSSPVIELEECEEEEEDRCSEGVLRIEHTMATTLEDVGKQVWRGALLLADFILSKPELFRGSTVLELGAGTGLTSIIMATTATRVYCTDVGEDLLRLCKRNISLNKHKTEPAGKVLSFIVLIKGLISPVLAALHRLAPSSRTEFNTCKALKDQTPSPFSRCCQLSTCSQVWSLTHLLVFVDAGVEFSWTEEEVADLYDNTRFIVAADVCYDDDLTDGLFRTLYRLCSSFTHSCTIFISLEKRMNFTLRHMDVTCQAYNHFRRCLSQLQDLSDGRCVFRVEQVPLSFSQFLLYERIEQLELWKLSAALLPLVDVQLDSDLLSS
ncbi:methyltransferase like 22 [Nothobranchius furzeri]|uniref:Methyltransferase like 22 n=1 Tax=Nothobranchius furzeri TaxID=105023 RepID=A0A9D3BB34_NOTFU|nr:methyltransferase like 22 [Nothobranchius furzeri]